MLLNKTVDNEYQISWIVFQRLYYLSCLFVVLTSYIYQYTSRIIVMFVYMYTAEIHLKTEPYSLHYSHKNARTHSRHGFAAETFFETGGSVIATQRALSAYFILYQNDAVLDGKSILQRV